MNRNRVVAGALGLVVAAGALGWVAGSRISSPAEAAARAEAPEASLITVAVDERLLSADIVTRGSIDFDDPEALALSGSIGDADSQPIVTMALDEGTSIAEGDVVLVVSGRPVLMLQGELPVYRDLRPGSTGDDVYQLESALKRLGLLEVANDRWDASTGGAIQALYARVGHVANATSASDKAQLDSARDQVRYASQAVADANAALDSAGGATGSALIAARNAVSDAKGYLAVAEAQSAAAIASAEADVTVAAQALADAQATHAVAVARRDMAVDTNVHPDTGVAPTALELAELESDVTAAELTVAQRTSEHSDAINTVTVVTAEQDSAVASASRSVDLANAQLSEAQSPGDRTSLIRARDEARRQLSDASAALASVESGVGTWIPAGELIFVDRMPVQAARVSAVRGEPVPSTFMTVSGADIAMIIGMPADDAARLDVGDEVIIDEPDLLEETIVAHISEIPDPGSSGRVQVVVVLDEVPEQLLGSNVRVIIPVESTDGEVLVVPAAALSAVANGDTRVEVEDADNPGTTRFVTVATGLATDGVVEVRALDGTLVKGDRVVVGQADIGPVDQPDDSDDSDDETAPSDDGS